MAFGWTAPTRAFGSHVRKANRCGSPSTGRQMPANAKRGSSVSSNQTLRFLPVIGSGSDIHSEKEVTGTRQRRSGLESAVRQKGEDRLRTLTTGARAEGGGG